MTKKDYKLLARLFKEVREELEEIARESRVDKEPAFNTESANRELEGRIYELREIKSRLIDILKQDNERFDVQKFIEYIE